MNILPHKSWHVRTKKNIARVRKDEAQAAEEEKERQRKIALAGQEARTAQLRLRASERLATASATAPISATLEELTIPLAPVTDIVQKDGHVNFFVDVEEGRRQGGVNDEAEAEKKAEQEDYEKKIGYLVYLGQDSEEANKSRPWYAKTIERGGGTEPRVKEGFEKVKTFENSGYLEGHSKKCDLTPDELKLAKFKRFQDPLSDIRRYLKTPSIAKKMEDEVKIKKKVRVEASSGSKRKRSRSPSPSAHSSSSSHKKSKKSRREKKKKSKKSKHKSSKHSESKSRAPDSSSSEEEETSEDERKRKNLEKLRAERLEREREERRRTEQLLAKLRGDKPPEEVEKERAATSAAEMDGGTVIRSRVKQKYNSQFNPELARQNYDFA